jgi:hypothetical protein
MYPGRADRKWTQLSGTQVEAEMSIPLTDKWRLRCKNCIPGTRQVLTYNVVQHGTDRRNCDLKTKYFDLFYIKT